MKTDPIFYRLFQALPGTFFELIGRSPAAAIAYEFRSVEIKQTAFRIDGVFIPVSGSDPQPILFAEVQFQKEPDFYYRLFSEITLYLRQYKPAVVYKFPQASRQALEAMLGLGELKETKFYQEVAHETKIEAVPRLLKLGLSIEQVAEALDLPVEEVNKIAQLEQ